MTEAIIAIGAVIAALLGAVMWGRKSAKDDAKMDQLQDGIDAHEIRDEVENRVASERDARERLRNKWQR
jgi:hypothetical protein